MHILTGGGAYLLGRRSLQEAARGQVSRYDAKNACDLLEMYGLIKILDRGTPSQGKGKGAARYRYLGQVTMPTPAPESDDDEEPIF